MAMDTAKSVWSGHSCPLPLTLVLLLILVCGVDSLRDDCGEMGQLLIRRIKGKGKVKIRVKGSGQECPLYTNTELLKFHPHQSNLLVKVRTKAAPLASVTGNKLT